MPLNGGLLYDVGVLFLGHIAASLLIADATDSDRATAIAGNLVPDVTDKTGSWILKVMPSSRWIAHGLPCFAIVSLAAGLVLDGPRWRGFVLGYAGHLVCDLWNGDKVPWLAPFQKPLPKSKRRSKLRILLYLLPEVVGAAIISRLLRGPSVLQRPEEAGIGHRTRG